jgi:hypothetical protein
VAADVPGRLHPLGLSPAEEAAYELLVDRPRSTMAEIAAAWTRPEHPGGVVAGLEARGLIRSLGGVPACYTVAAPDVALDGLLVEQERRLQLAREYAAQLAALYHEHAASPVGGSVVELVTGNRAVERRRAQILRGARSLVRRFDKPPFLDEHATASTERQLLDQGVRLRTLYDRAFVDQPGALPGIEARIDAGEQARVLPHVPMRLWLVDQRLAILPLHRQAGATERVVVVHPSALLDALSKLFESLWQRALPLYATGNRPRSSRRGRSPADDQRLIALLLSGLTDDAIARQLGLGHRTVQRRIAGLMRDLGVKTRFQAGVQAAFREAAATAPQPPPAGDP